MGFGGFVDPKERAAAQEAAAAMEKQRALADAHTTALCEAIRDGFATLASAIVAAAGPNVVVDCDIVDDDDDGGDSLDIEFDPTVKYFPDSEDVDDLLQNGDPDK
jgi:hypothetical protein